MTILPLAQPAKLAFSFRNSAPLATPAEPSLASDDNQSISLFDSDTQSDLSKSFTFFDSSHDDTAELPAATAKYAPILSEIESGTPHLTNSKINSTHPINSKFECAKCHVALDKLSFLAIHNRMYHQQSRHYECPQCRHTCETLNDLTTHCQRHQTVQLNCPQCEEAFTDCRLYQMHLSIHLIELENSMTNVDSPLPQENTPEIDYATMMQQLDALFTEYIYSPKYTMWAENFACTSCGVNFTSKLRLSIHRACCHRRATGMAAQWEE